MSDLERILNGMNAAEQEAARAESVVFEAVQESGTRYLLVISGEVESNG